MRRMWFRDEGDRYFRNFSLVERELEGFWNWNLPWRRRVLMADVLETSVRGVVEAEEVGRRDVVFDVRDCPPTPLDRFARGTDVG